MSFYENQHRARRKTGLLVSYFVAAVLLIILAVNAVAFVSIRMSSTYKPLTLLQWLQSPACWSIAGITLAVIVLGSLFRMAQLSKGGLSVALMAGGTPLDPGTSNLQERTLINITEEMAIASGTPVPRIFVLRNEPGINAFVAGTDSSNTVLAVTQGALDYLSRDELQGVIGHEFSHILNGDMGLNVRLIGILAGILLIGKIGESLLRGQRYRSSRNNKGQAQAAMLGLALMIIGYVGLFFGRLIKAAISRQREFLADASSVQFTRNPDGIAGALYAIGQLSNHGKLMTSHAEDMSHMCFEETLHVGLSSLLATHPPIEDRIKALDPTLLPRLKARFRQRNAGTSTESVASTQSAVATDSGASGFAGATTLSAAQNSAIKASVGQPTPAHTAFAHDLMAAISNDVMEAAHQPQQAEALLYALLLTELRSHAQESLALLAAKGGDTLTTPVKAFHKVIKQNDPAQRLPLLDICVATLRVLDAAQQDQIVVTSEQLIKIDQRITLSEFIMVYLIRQGLNPPHRPARAIKRFSAIESSLAILFSAMVQGSGETAELQQRNFTQIMQSYSRQDWSAQLQTPPTVKQLTFALDQLNRLTPLLKQPVVDACVDCVLHDGKATLRELELLRAVCEALQCPMPPLQVTLSSV